MRRGSLIAFACGLMSFTLASPTVASEDKVIEEKYPSGKLRVKYQVNDADEKDGPFTEYYETGKVRAKGTYKAGQLDGEYTAYYPNGTKLASGKYAAGALTGTYTENYPAGGQRLSMTYQDGAVRNLKLMQGGRTVAMQDFGREKWAPPRRLAEIQLDLADLATLPPLPKKAASIEVERESALRRLMAYRAVVGVPFRDLVLDDEMNKQAAAGVELCQAIGKLTHTPANTVNWPEEKYQFAYKGTTRSNLGFSARPEPLSQSVDGWMDDSDPTNIDDVGHRRWCINPTMLKTGFGKSPSGTYTAIWAHDRSRTEVPDDDFVAYPSAGFAASNYFGPRYAWSFSPNPKKFRFPPDNEVTVKLYLKTDRTPDGLGKELKLDAFHVSTTPYGTRPAVIFRPAQVSLAEGSRYVVVIDRLLNPDGEKVKVSYMVIFVATI